MHAFHFPVTSSQHGGMHAVSLLCDMLSSFLVTFLYTFLTFVPFPNSNRVVGALYIQLTPDSSSPYTGSSFWRTFQIKQKLIGATGVDYKVQEAMSRSYQSHHYTLRRKTSSEREWNRVLRKRVMVVIDQSMGAKHAMLWALTHVANEGDVLTLLHVIPGDYSCSDQGGYQVPGLARSLGSLCNAMRPEVGTEALVLQGPKLATVLALVKKLDVSVLVLRQSRPSSLCCMTKSRNEDFVEQCIDNSECLTMSVRKRSSAVGGYMISTRWQKNFWLLA